MEYSFVFLGKRNRKKILEDISAKVKLLFPSYQIVFLTNNKPKTEKLSTINKNLNFKTIIFKETSTNDEMFETFIKQQDIGNVILFKESAVNINFNYINKMIEYNRKGNLLIVSKQEKKESILNKIFKPIKNFLARIFLGVKLFDAEADIVLLDKVLVSTMNEIPGKSAGLTKINGWAGIEPKYVTIDKQFTKEKQKNNIRDFYPLIAISSLLILFVITDVLFGVLKIQMHFLLFFLFIIAQVSVLVLLLYSLTKIFFRLKFGKISYTNEAEIVEEIDNFEE
jgi:hypothetical protein